MTRGSGSKKIHKLNQNIFSQILNDAFVSSYQKYSNNINHHVYILNLINYLGIQI